MKNFSLGALLILLIGTSAFIFYQNRIIQEQNFTIAILEENWDYEHGIESAAEAEIFYEENDEEEDYYEDEIIDLGEEFYRMIDVYPDHSIPALFPEFIRNVLHLEDYNDPDSYYNYEKFYNLKSCYYDYATYYNWYFDFPEYMEEGIVQQESEGFFWSDYLRSFDRSSNNIESLFNKHKDLIYSLISKDLYYGSDLNEYVNILLAVQDDLKSKNPETLYDDLYKSGEEYLWTNNFEPVMDHSLVDDWYRHDDEYYEENEVFWIYSFWYRRWLEGNQRVVYNSLKEVQQHYNN